MKHISTAVHLSIKNPEKALEKLLLEKEKRTVYYWRMKDDSEIAVDLMSNEHLDNTIRMLQRKVAERAIYDDAAEGFPEDWNEYEED